MRCPGKSRFPIVGPILHHGISLDLAPSLPSPPEPAGLLSPGETQLGVHQRPGSDGLPQIQLR